MVNPEIAGLTSNNPIDWQKLAAAYGRDILPTGGLPAIPADAENNGTIDPSTFEVGMTIDVVTQSGTKYVLTAAKDGQVTVERFIWDLKDMRRGMRYYSYDEDMDAYKEEVEWHDKHAELAKQGFDVNVPRLREEPWKFSPRPFRVEPIRANESLVVLDPEEHGKTYIKTSPVAYWVINRP